MIVLIALPPGKAHFVHTVGKCYLDGIIDVNHTARDAGRISIRGAWAFDPTTRNKFCGDEDDIVTDIDWALSLIHI